MIDCSFRGVIMTSLLLDPSEFVHVRTIAECIDIVTEMVAVTVPDVTWDPADITEAAERVLHLARKQARL